MIACASKSNRWRVRRRDDKGEAAAGTGGHAPVPEGRISKWQRLGGLNPLGLSGSNVLKLRRVFARRLPLGNFVDLEQPESGRAGHTRHLHGVVAGLQSNEEGGVL